MFGSPSDVEPSLAIINIEKPTYIRGFCPSVAGKPLLNVSVTLKGPTEKSSPEHQMIGRSRSMAKASTKESSSGKSSPFGLCLAVETSVKYP